MKTKLGHPRNISLATLDFPTIQNLREDIIYACVHCRAVRTTLCIYKIQYIQDVWQASLLDRRKPYFFFSRMNPFVSVTKSEGLIEGLGVGFRI